ncbi:Gfo/Idh/MocA family protein [Fodinibius sp. SL11]|uniref:Gfo/Idh/MocA family protein n=1 Tax=Fodinibius sp. SL11 TaxID=3425690 RepID=UPI003F885C23
MAKLIRYGMVGGGPGSFIGKVHRMAANLDGKMRLVAGSFSSDSEKSRRMGSQLNLQPDRVYESYQQMAENEAALHEDKRIDVVSVVVPNNLHYDVCKTFIEAGVHVICDKPMTNTLEEAEELCRLVAKHNTLFALTHNYSGYPMVKEARQLVEEGTLGTLRKVVVEYPQGWLARSVENEAEVWRLNPNIAGISSTIADIGTHAEHLVRFITGAEIEELYADINTFVDGRTLEDDANLLVHYKNGMRGILYASQVSIGEENALKIRLYGDQAALEWEQEQPNELRLKYPDKPEEIYRRGNSYLSEAARYHNRIPAGHPEGFIEAFANIYSNVADVISARKSGAQPDKLAMDFPTVQDGARGVHFIHKAIESGKQQKWVDMDYTPPT